VFTSAYKGQRTQRFSQLGGSAESTFSQGPGGVKDQGDVNG